MINKPKNWESVQPTTYESRVQLPVGAYVVRIFGAEIKTSNSGKPYLKLSFDIAEGQYAGFFKTQYDSSVLSNRNWHGWINQGIPTDDGCEADERIKGYFAAFVKAICDSNPGFVWTWDEQTLNGKLVGVLFRNEEWDWNGKHGWSVRPLLCMSAERVRSGDYKLPREKPLHANTATSGGYSFAPTAQNNGFTAVETDDLPF